MRNITAVTKRDIFDLFKNGIEQQGIFFEIDHLFYSYYGRIEIVDFLKRLYDLSSMKSLDSRVNNAEEDIKRHTYNGDYPDNWIFEDERFELLNGNDEIFLNFLCEVFHPEVRNEKGFWKLFLENINNLLQKDGYELFVSSKLSGRDVYGWRIYFEKSSMFIPFSERNKSLITSNKIKISISNKARYQLFKVMNEYNEVFSVTDETNWNYYKSVSEFVFDDIIKFYIPKHFVGNEYVEIKEFNDFKDGTTPFTVFDVIESFNRHTTKSEQFKNEINATFKLNNINVELKDGKIHSINNKTPELSSSIKINEAGLEELIRTAENLYSQGEYSYAVEKIWDAFERVKTYYHPTLDKRKSAEKIIKDISYGNENIKEMFDIEFKTLTSIGNSYRIRHHEKDKIDILNELHYEYFYKRCLTLISIIMENLQ